MHDVTAPTPEIAALQARVRVLEEALRRALGELGGKHIGHWDKTGQGGNGCPVCIDEYKLKDELHPILAASPAAALDELEALGRVAEIVREVCRDGGDADRNLPVELTQALAALDAAREKGEG